MLRQLMHKIARKRVTFIQYSIENYGGQKTNLSTAK